MLAGAVPSGAAHWKRRSIEGGFAFEGPHATLTLKLDPWSLALTDPTGKPIWSTHCAAMATWRCRWWH